MEKFKVNGVDITLTEEEIAEQKQLIKDEFNLRKNELINRIKKDRDETEDYVRQRVLDEILYRGAYTEADYDRMKFMYNNGYLRSNQEVEEYNSYQRYTKERENYSHKCKKNNFIGFWLPFWIVFIIFCLILHDIIFLPVALLFGLIAGFIGLMHGYKTNINNAKKYGMSPDDPYVQNEKAKYRTGVVSGTVALGSMIHNTKKSSKELFDVESWKKFN